jgi:carbon monoxide dehydrogenase subunit G
MAHYTTTVHTDWERETAFAYLAEFSNAAEWDPGVERALSLSPDPIAAGARFELEVSFVGRTIPMTYETIELDAPSSVTLAAETGLVVSRDVLSFDPAPGGGTTVTYDADLRLKGPMKLLDPALQVAFKRIGDQAADGLAARLAGPAPAGER